MLANARIRILRDRPVRRDGDHVVYWMTASRRLDHNFALDRAVDHARTLERPLLVLEGLRCGYRWASDRIHRFVLDGMAEHRKRLRGSSIGYLPYVEPAPGAGRGLLEALAERACVVVADDSPAFFLPRMLRSAAAGCPARLEAVDSNGLVPLQDAGRAFPTAYAFRRYLQKVLPDILGDLPRVRLPSSRGLAPWTGVPEAIRRRWPAAADELLDGDPAAIAALPVDHDVAPVGLRGGTGPGRAALRSFLSDRLSRYVAERNHPDLDASSGLSPYLHFGHISSHEVFARLAAHEDWTPMGLGDRRDGARTGYWGMSEDAEAFVDQFVTWRELGFHTCAYDPAYDRYESLPDWARATLAEHASDPRDNVYDRAEFESAATHDPLWNAAQRQLVREGRVHNYLRMLWGKKILEWTPDPRVAFEIMVELNNRWALDGRDPNSYSGIQWVLGRYDRPWGPERPIFGKVRYMTSRNTARKVRTSEYVREYGD